MSSESITHNEGIDIKVIYVEWQTILLLAFEATSETPTEPDESVRVKAFKCI